ncbi:MAG: TolB family protein [Pseudohongiellaceae bacterium]
MNIKKHIITLGTFAIFAILVTLTACDETVDTTRTNSGYSRPETTTEPLPTYATTGYETELLSNTRLLVQNSRRSGEGYFSADGTQFIYQSEEPDSGNPFYQIFLMDLSSGETRRVSPGTGLTTCSWIHPSLDRIMFSSTHEDPDTLNKQAQEIALRESGQRRRYGWDYDPNYEIWQANSHGGELTNLTNSEGYDAEGSYSADGTQILFASNREAYTRPLSQAEQKLFNADNSYFMDLYIMDATGNNVKQLTFSPGYDGGPFFSPDNNKIVWRRFNPDGNSAEIWTMNTDGSNQRQLTANNMVNWGPYYHPSGAYIIYSSNLLGHANFELFLIDTNGQHDPVRVTNTEGTDILPVFSPNGSQLAWSTTRTPDGTSQIHIANWNHNKAMQLLDITNAEQ